TNPDLLNYFHFLGIFAFFSVSNTILYSYFILRNEVKVNILVNLISNTALIVFLLLIVNLSASLHNVVLLRVFTYGGSFFAMLLTSNPFINLNFTLTEFFNGVKNVFQYTFPIALSLIVGVFSYQIDKLLVSILSS